MRTELVKIMSHWIKCSNIYGQLSGILKFLCNISFSVSLAVIIIEQTNNSGIQSSHPATGGIRLKCLQCSQILNCVVNLLNAPKQTCNQRAVNFAYYKYPVHPISCLAGAVSNVTTLGLSGKAINHIQDHHH